MIPFLNQKTISNEYCTVMNTVVFHAMTVDTLTWTPDKKRDQFLVKIFLGCGKKRKKEE